MIINVLAMDVKVLSLFFLDTKNGSRLDKSAWRRASVARDDTRRVSCVRRIIRTDEEV